MPPLLVLLVVVVLLLLVSNVLRLIDEQPVITSLVFLALVLSCKSALFRDAVADVSFVIAVAEDRVIIAFAVTCARLSLCDLSPLVIDA